MITDRDTGDETRHVRARFWAVQQADNDLYLSVHGNWIADEFFAYRFTSEDAALNHIVVASNGRGRAVEVVIV
jgi:hypothetical protein